MGKLNAKTLLQKYKSGTASASERQIVENWYHQLGNSKVEFDEETLSALEQEVWSQLPIHEEKQSSSYLVKYRLVWVAASLLLFIWVATYRLQNSATLYEDDSNNIVVYAGSNKAYITLLDGQEIELDPNTEGLNFNNSTLTYLDGSFVFAHESENTSDIQSQVKSVRTPKGGQYSLLLPDSSMVWLNSLTSISYSVSSDGKYREVILSGEAYFEVSKSTLPFLVKTRHQTVEVLGTHFNIQAYPDEAFTTTTLLEGSVCVYTKFDSDTEPKNPVILSPNEQSIVTENTLNITTTQVDPLLSIAWKNGLFRFDNTDIHTLMRQLSRWYDIDVQFKDNLNYEPFFGEIERGYELSAVLKVLEFGGVHFKTEERNGRVLITVMP